MRMGKFYIIAPDQLNENEDVYLCYRTREDAEEDMGGFYPNLRPEIRLLQTIESDTPFLDSAGTPIPNHEPTRFTSQRHFIVLVERKQPEQGA
jgi:hypothetical protein